MACVHLGRWQPSPDQSAQINSGPIISGVIGASPTAERAGRLAAILWISLPAVGVGSFVISTDTPLLLAWSAGLLGLIGVLSGRLAPRHRMALAGAGFGAAMLAKYAAIYGLVGLGLFLALMRARRQRSGHGWRGTGLWAGDAVCGRSQYPVEPDE